MAVPSFPRLACIPFLPALVRPDKLTHTQSTHTDKVRRARFHGREGSSCAPVAGRDKVVVDKVSMGFCVPCGIDRLRGTRMMACVRRCVYMLGIRAEQREARQFGIG
ncbi:hypothetical protein QBC47DRAFT_164909 [Echria macrotheca]|uniref:Uncharacterized protein n=1 Tax=Echria macrotheca TaxID=438768 RepID=A0AAJ0FBX0_9PEZI|nr:hypothetical protein QBC47DRAFT_164909 [Echria macrotheca]